jgi:hypothetical protein
MDIADQRHAYPLGAIVLLRRDLDLRPGELADAGTYGRVIDHYEDGRAVFSFGEWGTHTFSYPQLEDLQSIIDVVDGVWEEE